MRVVKLIQAALRRNGKLNAPGMGRHDQDLNMVTVVDRVNEHDLSPAA